MKVSFAQDDTIWFDSNWKEVSKKYANFYRSAKKTDKGFLVSDNYLDGNPQMVAEASQLEPLIKNGFCTYYYKNLKKGSYGFYKNGKKEGIWIEFFNNGKDSSVIRFLEDGTKNYIKKSKYEETFTVVEYMPEFQGGQAEMMKFIQSNIVYPKNSSEKKLGGKVFMKFIIDSMGNVNNVTVLKGTGIIEIDNEAKRVIELMPKWKPGSQNGKNVNVFFNLPINFYMDEPFFIFNINSAEEKYLTAKNLICNGELNEALSIYGKINGDAEVWYNMAVAYYLKKEKRESKNYFTKVIGNISDSKNVYYSQSKKFLEKYY